MAKISQRQVIAKAIALNSSGTELPISKQFGREGREYFAQVSGGEIQASVEKVYDGGATYPDVLPAPIEVGDVTLTRHYDPDIDADVISFFRNTVGKQRFRVEVYTTDADGVLVGKVRKYEKCILVNITEPDGDSSSGGPATFSLTFAVGISTDATAAGTTI
jgi:hypothetical protein